MHSNMCFANTAIGNLKYFLGSLWPSLIANEYEIGKIYPITSYYGFLLEESGYMHIQATKPDTVGKLKYSDLQIELYLEASNFFLIRRGPIKKKYIHNEALRVLIIRRINAATMSWKQIYILVTERISQLKRALLRKEQRKLNFQKKGFF